MAEDKLLSVESQTEHSMTSGKSETKIFVKMYVDAVKAGLIADLGADNWQTLCVIASHMDKDSECFPTHAQIAKGLGVRRETATRRVKKLADYRWNGRPLIVSEKGRTEKGTWDNTRYTILPISQLRIFENEPEDITTT
ncbi:hypothetical protein JOC34_002882 [Virgibacillus halotolerans]|uniref:helix-turn-helix domain-containing protein n=1 Tax=Virgibacillus halotolerans TaxID=1071053 RepID=UPI001960E86F|nr:helix-turn-helix domain-containing protein [Virgibacillus halotolerans]MBM7600491.1 hypothetical protein [Virgibacillus halotolerans]